MASTKEREAREERRRQKLTEKQREKTVAEQHQQEVIDRLSELGEARTRDTSIAFGKGFTLPSEYEDDLEGAVRFLDQYVEDQETVIEFSKTFMRRPWDGAVCMVNAMQKNFGAMGRQRGQGGFFFYQPPEQRAISTGPHGETVTVPWGMMEFPLFKGSIVCGSENHRTYGLLFHITITAAKKYASQIDGFFKLIEEECKNHSIYQGKVIDGQPEPEFIDPYDEETKKMVFSADTWTQLRANLWTTLEHGDVHRDLGLSRNRKVLVTGEYGTGKTMTIAKTLQVATENGWTAMVCRPGRDNLDKVMQTARLYQPCVVAIEDIDLAASGQDSDAMARMLDLFDGVQAKGVEVLGVLTTNHTDKIHKAMWRPGRLDAVVKLGNLDREGVKTMVELLITEDMRKDIDYDKVFESMAEYPPAFVKGSITRAIRYAVANSDGVRPDSITTHDLVSAADGFRPQYEQMRVAEEVSKPDSLGAALETHVTKVLSDGKVGVDYGAAASRDDQIAPIISAE